MTDRAVTNHRPLSVKWHTMTHNDTLSWRQYVPAMSRHPQWSTLATESLYRSTPMSRTGFMTPSSTANISGMCNQRPQAIRTNGVISDVYGYNRGALRAGGYDWCLSCWTRKSATADLVGCGSLLVAKNDANGEHLHANEFLAVNHVSGPKRNYSDRSAFLSGTAETAKPDDAILDISWLDHRLLCYFLAGLMY